MKMIFVVFTINENGKSYSFADTIKAGENILAYCQRYNSDVCHLCESRKQAEQIAHEWNERYKENGRLIF